MMDWIIRWGKARLQEPTTWKGAIAILTALGVAISPELAKAIIALGLAIGGVINVITPEPAAAPRPAPAERLHDDPVPTPDGLPPVRFKSPEPNPFKDLDRFGQG